jgi:osmoprotectant transport system ATP-binding protein
VISLHGCGKTYGSVTALHPTDLTFAAGKITALIGPSGCGKSTLLRLVIGLIPPSTGYVEVDGQRLTPANLQEMRWRMGYVIQEGGLFPHLTASDNVQLLSRFLGRENAARLTELCDLTHFPADGLSRYPVELSGGQKQRVSLMRALMLDPEVLLLDEPLGALDPMVRSTLQRELKELFQRLGKTVILVTHDMAEAGYLGDTIVMLREGKIVQQGSLEDLQQRPADPFVTEFINAQRSLVAL